MIIAPSEALNEGPTTSAPLLTNQHENADVSFIDLRSYLPEISGVRSSKLPPLLRGGDNSPGARSKFWGVSGSEDRGGVTTVSNSLILGGWVTKVLKNCDKK